MLIFRFTAGLMFVLSVSVIGIRLEKDELALKRTISLQHYRMDQLLVERSRLRVRLHELTGPAIQLADPLPHEAEF